MSHARRLPRLLAAGMLLAPALALPLVVGSTTTASARASTRTNVNGTTAHPVHSRIGHPLTRGRQVGRATIHARQPFSRTWG